MLPGLAVVGLQLAPTEARAAPRSTRLVYVRAANAGQCADERGVRLAVAVRLGYDPFVAYAETTLVVEVRAASTTAGSGASGFEADIHVVQEDGVEAGKRRIVSEGLDCQKIVDALALSLSIIVDPVGALRAPAAGAGAPAVPVAVPVEPETSATPLAPATAMATPSIPASIPSIAAAPQFVPSFVMSPFASVGEAPSVTAGIMVSARVRVRSFSLGVDVRADLPASHTGTSSDTTVQSHSVTGWLAPCLHAGGFEGCGLVGAGALFASSNAVEGRTSTSLLWSVGGRAGFSVPLGRRSFARAFVDVVVTPVDPRYGIDEKTVYTFPVVGGDVGLGLGAQFP